MKRMCMRILSFVLLLSIIVTPVAAYSNDWSDNMKAAYNLHYDWMDDMVGAVDSTDLQIQKEYIFDVLIYKNNIPDSEVIEFVNSCWKNYWLAKVADLQSGIPTEYYDYFHVPFFNACSYDVPLDTSDVYFNIISAEKGKYIDGRRFVDITVRLREYSDVRWYPTAVLVENTTGKIVGVERYKDEIKGSETMTFVLPSYFDEMEHTLYMSVYAASTFYAVTEIDVSSLSEPPVPEPVRGDADGSGALDLLDVTLTLKYLAEWEGITLDKTAADISGNDKVNLSDVSLMLQIIAGWNV